MFIQECGKGVGFEIDSGLLAASKPAVSSLEVVGSGSVVTLELNQDELYIQGFTNVVLGADSMEITLVGKLGGEWFAKVLNLRGVSPLGGSPANIHLSRSR